MNYKNYVCCFLIYELKFFFWLPDWLHVQPAYTFSRAKHQLHVLSRLAPSTCSPRLAPLSVFSRLATITRFPAFGAGYMVSRAKYQLHLFPRLATVTSSLAFGADYRFSRAWFPVACLALKF